MLSLHNYHVKKAAVADLLLATPPPFYWPGAELKKTMGTKN